MIDFTYLYHKNIESLYAFGSRLTSDSEMLKDCIQDVFTKFYAKRDSLGTVKNIENYLYISLRNRINDEFRRNARLCDDEINDSKMSVIAESEDYNREWRERQTLLSTNIEQFFDKLSPRQQQIIRLYYMEQRKYDDICKIMGINYQSVRNLMHRSISRLREYASQMQLSV